VESRVFILIEARPPSVERFGSNSKEAINPKNN
jgi:hypothetical protein